MSTAARPAKHPFRNYMAVAIKDNFREFGLVITIDIFFMHFR
jgi:hypothetical protein